ncbi:protein of unknown function [Magnetospirillum gryphiswaldense MSR-1 v2]|uniref:Uncharacterized protein n=1 Tax=Magnetospirillum gryphiswaldense (strain DSM 6361 / JCM 21280 / NBRC 15271 / MSR-1) TaxID=431944 RepID=V6F8K3_MAGGM|nr:protein of unknown function [Magnetospirillum gryphiswaldense MSR-1 v2]
MRAPGEGLTTVTPDRWDYILRGDAEGRLKGKRPSVSPREGVTSANGGDTDAALGNPARCAWNKE